VLVGLIGVLLIGLNIRTLLQLVI